MSEEAKTPETDALSKAERALESISLKYQQLERERDDARKQLEPRNGHTFESVTKMWEDTHIELANVISERDQLRKVADELAQCLMVHWEPGFESHPDNPVGQVCLPLCNYDALPHVIARKERGA